MGSLKILRIHFTLHTVFRTELLTLYWRSQCYVISQRLRSSTTSWARASPSAALCKFVVASVLSFDDKFFLADR